MYPVLQVSTSKPGESLCGSDWICDYMELTSGLNLQAWRIPLWVFDCHLLILQHPSLNLQAWRIPLWVTSTLVGKFLYVQSQPPSLENPFVGPKNGQKRIFECKVSTSKPGESLCGRIFQIKYVIFCTESQPPSLENPFVGHCRYHPTGAVLHGGLNLQAWRIPLWDAVLMRTEPLRLPRLNLQAWRIPLWDTLI